ncbi:hypothetical protein [Melghirimyces algeriensis]|uniref:LSM domain-containing protein n=1 Tax=Melghirimyces algeriensis TaxID=910412 RepID=A0A521ADH1_9BACL|nr:hypothetical protein [Melghirimyces algeriensis]SMO32865.1 hypothetical protein SAMN06264849_10175 [Melghirimyces algeriensis]
MRIGERLQDFIGQTIQVFTADGMIEGQLTSATDLSITIVAPLPPGYGPPTTIVIIIQTIFYIRIP